MSKPLVLIADWLMPDFDLEQQRFEESEIRLSVPQWRPPQPPRDEQRRLLMERIRETPRIDAVLFQLAPLDREVIDLLPDTCRLFQRLGIGLDTLDLQRADELGIPVRNTPEYCIEEVAVHAMGMLLSLHRQLGATHQALLSGEWLSHPPQPIERLSGQTLGLVGMGRIARKLGEWMRPLVGRVVYFDPHVTDAPSWAESLPMETLLREADLISLHCPLLSGTRHMINAETLSLVKPTTLIVNAARGGLIDAAALAVALSEGRLGGAGLDVFEPEILPDDSPLRSCPNTILTSHTAWYSRQAIIESRTTAINNILQAIAGTQ